MQSWKVTFTKFVKFTTLVMALSFFLQGCLQASKNKRTNLKSASTTENPTTGSAKIPEFKSGNNFIQNGVNVFTSNITLNLNFNDSLQLRGKDVDSYIRGTSTTSPVCLTSRFTQIDIKKVIILAAIPRSVYNFTTKTLEYYYNIAPADEQSNQSFCQKTGLINQLFTLYSSENLAPAFKLGAICPTGTCATANNSSLGIELFNTTGLALTQIATKQLVFKISNDSANGEVVGDSCVDSAQCIGQGFDCCSAGQCIKDLALKPNVSTSSNEYLQALQDILNNPSNIYLYPEFYFICSQPTNQPENPVKPVDPVSEAAAHLRKLTSLYNCTTKIEGEAGTCSKIYPNIKIEDNLFYETEEDDRNFSSTFTHQNVDLKQTLTTIEKVIYGGVVVYDYSTKTNEELSRNIYEDNLVRIEGHHNDVLNSKAKVKIRNKPAGATSTDLEILYKVDASCKLINAHLAQCEKYYIQGQSNKGNTQASNLLGRVTDHFPDSNIFKLPNYANTSNTIRVDVDGVAQKRDQDWQLVQGNPSTIEFLPSTRLNVFKDQKVRITFYTRLQDHPNVMVSKLKALEEIKKICSCADTNCSLKPVTNSAKQLVDYACIYPEPPAVEPPMTQKIYLSSKTVPVRFFDKLGVSKASVTADTTPQENINIDDVEFAYTNNNLLTPNNIPTPTKNNYIGFNEIYGNLSYTNGSAKPAREVAVKKGNFYDIYVDRGSVSNCVQCGNDYYSQLTKLFPLTQFGGGAIPMLGQTNRTMTNGIRSDELKFGRACLVPATMLPWSHKVDSEVQTQRKNRMRLQHFLFANGYQFDWYGFDYGSVIGSFDGVKWFSIGSSRRIKAETNKMFLAVNTLMGDLTIESTYEVSINDGILNPLGSEMISTDYNSDGAECQQFHKCSTDNDCATTLGWDYACAPVSEITTSWPVFDDNAKEMPDTASDINSLASILKVSSPGKRCVYRGRGALCSPNYAAVNSAASFNQSTNPAFHSCSTNNYCQSLTSGGVYASKFNNRIARYGKVKVDSSVDSFGLGAPLAGRPFLFNGTEKPQTEVTAGLGANKIVGMCLPGRDVEKTSYLDQNSSIPAMGDFNGDRVLGIGMTHRRTTLFDPNYLAACSVMNNTKNYYHNSTIAASALFSNVAIYPDLKYDAGSQSISTNALNAFNSIFTNKTMTFGLYKSNNAILDTMSFTENRCLRAPGASCFSDLDCAPSKIIADKIKSLSTSDALVTSILNKYEVTFWQEELVCSQAITKTDPLFDPKNNRCCREVGKTISLPSADISNGLDLKKIPGVDYSIAATNRYSRASTMYKEVNKDGTNFPELRTAAKDQCSSPVGCLQIQDSHKNQFKTFSALAEKTSCSGDWVRSFNGTNQKWESNKFQTFDPTMFRCLNWYPGSGGYTCSQYEADDPTCPVAQTQPNSPKAKEVLNYLAKMELMGIPQITLESQDHFDTSIEAGFSCKSDPADRNAAYPNHPTSPAANFKSPSNLFAASATREYRNLGDAIQWYSAVDHTNFVGMKQIFKPDEVRGCLPAGTEMKPGDNPNLCCTGLINSANNKCQLGDFVDISVYTNRYVSSEAKKLNATLFDNNGYLKDPLYAASLACEKSMCASGTIAYGLLVSRLKVPGQENLENKYFRFLEGSMNADDENGLLQLFKKGLKLNNHAYCVPEGLEEAASVSDDIAIITCEN